MATKGVFRVECPHCGEAFDADFWTVVRGDRDHDVKELILSGEFDLLMCPKCEKPVRPKLDKLATGETVRLCRRCGETIL